MRSMLFSAGCFGVCGGRESDCGATISKRASSPRSPCAFPNSFVTHRLKHSLRDLKIRYKCQSASTPSFSLRAQMRSPILFLGRLDPVKKVDTFVRALEQLHEQTVPFSAQIVGDPTDPRSNYAHDVRNLASPLCLEGVLSMHPAVTNDAARDLFRSHAIYCNLTPSGSFDKTIGEAMAAGAVVVARNNVLEGIVPKKLIPEDDSDTAAAQSLRAALEMPEGERRALMQQSRSWIEREHSLSLLVERLFGILSA